MSIEKSPKIPICQDHHSIDLDSSADLRLEALDNSKAQRMAEFFRLLGDGNRLRILSLLAQQDLCVCDLAGLLSMSLLDHHVLELYQSVAEHLAEVDTA
jgi:ArsR family transcriptional regulator, lead/cadmium/zinc/bismuth-responsive transcriptional repressor